MARRRKRLPEGMPIETTKQLHARQEGLWGWHDYRNKSASQLSSPCKANATGRCDRRNCCLRRGRS